MTFDRKLLHFFVADALREYSENVIFLNSGNPFQFTLNGIKYSARVSYVHDSGENRLNENEDRGQIPKSMINAQRQKQREGFTPAFLGFFEGGEVFAAWDPNHVFAFKGKTNCSLYAEKSFVPVTKANGAALHKFHSTNLGVDAVTIALPSELLGFYLENIAVFHSVRDQKTLDAIVNSFTKLERSGDTAQTTIEIERTKRTLTTTRTAYVRDTRFTREVMEAYNGKCCICARQLGLVQAAHIIPHAHPDSKDTVTNGLALCIEHHTLYDDALLMPDTERALYLNPNRVKFLIETGKDNGLEDIRKCTEKKYAIPGNAKLQPDPAYLEAGIKIRLA